MERYTDDVRAHEGRHDSADFLLLSLDGSAESRPAEWRLLRYRSLGHRLASISVALKGYRRHLLEDYSRVVIALDEILGRERPHWFRDSRDAEVLTKLRIDDVFEKRKADRLHRKLMESLAAVPLVARPDVDIPGRTDANCIYVHHGMTRTQALVGAVVRVGAVRIASLDRAIDVVAGVQLQGGQLRSYVEFQLTSKPDLSTSAVLRKIAERFFAIGVFGQWWHHQTPVPRGKRKASTVNQFDGRFFYRYRRIEDLDAKETTIDALAVLIANMVSDARRNRDAIRVALESAASAELGTT